MRYATFKCRMRAVNAGIQNSCKYPIPWLEIPRQPTKIDQQIPGVMQTGGSKFGTAPYGFPQIHTRIKVFDSGDAALFLQLPD
jgi:hypothetical protein